ALSQHADIAFARIELTGDELHERALAGAVRPEQTRDARRHADRDVVQTDHLSIPLRQMIRGHDGHGLPGRPRAVQGGPAHHTTSTPRTRRSRTEIETATRPSNTSSDTNTGVS